jgi:hypothetical protein
VESGADQAKRWVMPVMHGDRRAGFAGDVALGGFTPKGGSRTTVSGLHLIVALTMIPRASPRRSKAGSERGRPGAALSCYPRFQPRGVFQGAAPPPLTQLDGPMLAQQVQ